MENPPTLKMSKQDALDVFRQRSDVMVEVLGISKQAFWQWDKAEIPEKQALKIFWLRATNQLKDLV